MNTREIFGIGVRLIGVWFWSQAAYWAYWAAIKAAAGDLGNPNISVREDLAYGCLYLLLGSVLFLGARSLVWLAYGEVSKANNTMSGD